MKTFLAYRPATTEEAERTANAGMWLSVLFGALSFFALVFPVLGQASLILSWAAGAAAVVALVVAFDRRRWYHGLRDAGRP